MGGAGGRGARLPESGWTSSPATLGVKSCSGPPVLEQAWLCPHQDGSPQGPPWPWVLLNGGWFPAAPRGGRPSALPHTAGALQVGRPQTPVPWVGAPRPLGGHGLRLADLSGPRPGAQKLTHLGSTRPPHLCSPPSRPWAKPELREPQTALPPLSASPPTTLGNVWRGAQALPLGQCPSPVQAATPVWGPKGTPAPTDTTPGLSSR